MAGPFEPALPRCRSRRAGARATAIRCCWPPLSFDGRWLSRPSRLTVAINGCSRSSSTRRLGLTVASFVMVQSVWRALGADDRRL